MKNVKQNHLSIAPLFLPGRIEEMQNSRGIIMAEPIEGFGDQWFFFQRVEFDEYSASWMGKPKVGHPVWFQWSWGSGGKARAHNIFTRSGDIFDNPNLAKDPFDILVDHRHLNTLISAANTDDTPILAVTRIDLDGFKTVNDSFGHHAGDEILKAVFWSIRRMCELHGAIGIRAGGDEVVVILQDTQAERVESFAEQLRKAIAETTVIFDNNKLNVTASIGVACRPPFQTNLDREADRAAIKAKNEGKNRVVWAKATD
ncbi:GGDEF domain-containing protein [Candidatus Latescibacterota bacterium]